MIQVELRPPQVMVDNPLRIIWHMPNTAIEVAANNRSTGLVDRYSFTRVTGELAAALKALDAFDCNASIVVKILHGQTDTVGSMHFFREDTRPVVEMAVQEVEDKLAEIVRRWPRCTLTITYTKTTTSRTLT